MKTGIRSKRRTRPPEGRELGSSCLYPESIAVVGAGGVVGADIAKAIAYQWSGKVSRLVLVGRKGGSSSSRLIGLVHDMRDSAALFRQFPEIKLAWSPAEVQADVVVFAASIPDTFPPGKLVPRQRLAFGNYDVFTEWATEWSRHDPPSLVIVITNPVELGVALFAEAIGRERVAGIGAYVDSARFRTELAREFKTPAHSVTALVGGEHGRVVPFWDTIRIDGRKPRLDPAIKCALNDRLFHRIADTLAASGIEAAFNLLSRGSILDRTAFGSSLVYASGAKTGASVAQCVISLLDDLYAAKPRVISLQVIDRGIPIGLPVSVEHGHILARRDDLLASEERLELEKVRLRIKADLAAVKQMKRKESLPYQALLCPPTYFHRDTVKFGINVYSLPGTPVDNKEVSRQHRQFRAQLRHLEYIHQYGGRAVKQKVTETATVPAAKGQTLMVYAANGLCVFEREDGRRIGVPANYTFPQRAGEREGHRRWLEENGFEIIDIPVWLRQEGEGDLLPVHGTNLFIGAHGFRSDKEVYPWLEEQLRNRGFDVRILTVPSINPVGYHLDTWLAPLGRAPETGKQTALYFPKATTHEGRRTLAAMFEDLIEVKDAEAMRFACNSVVFDEFKIVILPSEFPRVARELRDRGYRVEVAEVGEFIKAGGQAKCLLAMTRRPEKLPAMGVDPRQQSGKSSVERTLLRARLQRILRDLAFVRELQVIAKQARSTLFADEPLRACIRWSLGQVARLPEEVRELFDRPLPDVEPLLESHGPFPPAVENVVGIVRGCRRQFDSEGMLKKDLLRSWQKGYAKAERLLDAIPQQAPERSLLRIHVEKTRSRIEALL